MQVCGLNALVDNLNVKICDMWEVMWQQGGKSQLCTSVPYGFETKRGSGIAEGVIMEVRVYHCSKTN